MQKPQILLADKCGLVAGQTLVVGVSGGADSLCLMEALRQAGHSILVAHFNHHLRPEAGAEAKAVAALARNAGLPATSGEGDVLAFARGSGRSIEDAARILRYEFLFAVARSHGAQAVAVGHTADDQVETVLMHFLRGAALTGLSGMEYRTLLRQFDRTIPLVRPILDTWHSEAVDFCAANNLKPIEDSSNSSLVFRRNRIRRELLPTLEAYNPALRKALQRMSRALAADRETLVEVVDAAWTSAVVGATASSVRFSASQLRTLSPALRANLIRRAVEYIDPLQEVDYLATERALSLLTGERVGAEVQLKGQFRAFWRNDEIVVSQGADAALPDHAPQLPEGIERIPLKIPGSVELGGGWIMTSTWGTAGGERAGNETSAPTRTPDPFEAWLDAAALPQTLELRIRRAGDRFQPLGMAAHSQKLADFMVNVKMPAPSRRRWPLLCSDETVIWVPGYRPAHPFRLTPETEGAAHFHLLRP